MRSAPRCVSREMDEGRFKLAQLAIGNAAKPHGQLGTVSTCATCEERPAMTDTKPRNLGELVLIAHILVITAAAAVAVQVWS